MSDIVFILGAGASKQGGAPLMADFLDVANNLLRANLVQDKRTQFEKVFDAIGKLQAVHSKAQLDLQNIESIFTVLELGKVIRQIPGIENHEIENTISALKDLIVRTIESTMQFPIVERGIRSPTPYDEFASLLAYLRKDAFPPESVAVITFNYDIAVDLSMYRARLDPDYMLSSSKNPTRGTPLLKLHGSLNWAAESKSGAIHPLRVDEYLSRLTPLWGDEGHIKVPIGSQLLTYFKAHKNMDVQSEPVIVPPSWNKAEYHSALSDVWAAAADHLSVADQIFIIGYSLPETDAFFRHLYALGSAGPKPLRRISVYNPDGSGAVKERFHALLGPGAVARYTYHELTFAKAINHIRGLFPAR